MSASIYLGARRQPAGAPRTIALVALPFILVLLVVGVASAELPAGVMRLSAADAERSGSVVRLIRHSVQGTNLVEVQPPGAGMSLLAVSADGSVVALADRLGDLSGALTLAASDGSQLRIALPGLLAASFAADGSWVAVVDGRGSLWRVDAATGRSEAIADGPFIGTPLVADGSFVMLSVSSVEAPYRSRLVRVAPDTGFASVLSAQELVYAAFPLDDGDMAVVAHEVVGTVVNRVGSNGERRLADLGGGAVNVSVAADGRIVFEVAGAGIYLVELSGSEPRRLGAGTRPCFAPDGSSVLVSRGQQRVALDLDGIQLAEAEGLAGFAGSVGCLP